MDLMWLFVGFAMCGNVFIIYKQPQGFFYWIIADLAFMVNNLANEQYAGAFIFLMYMVLSVIGLIKWENEKL